jgi:hydrogenase-1 operon protein HyaF
MLPFPIPVIAARTGPGSQPEEDEPNLLGVPSDMHVFRAPVNDSHAAPEVYRAALDVLRRILAGLETLVATPAANFRLSLLELNPAVRAEVNEMLGQGEVSILAEISSAQETAFTGLWRIHAEGVDDIEAATFPTALRELALMRQPLAITNTAPPAGLMNAPAILAEIRDASTRWQPGDAAHVINLSLLPVTPEDTGYLDAELGRAGISILSRGFGNCRITAAAWPNVWWVQYFNAMEKLILNSIEITDVPAVALAAAEDFADSRTRLDEWITSLASAT